MIASRVLADSAFSECSALQSVTIPDSVTSIGSYAFYGCRALRNVTVGKSVMSIGNEAFKNVHLSKYLRKVLCSME